MQGFLLSSDFMYNIHCRGSLSLMQVKPRELNVASTMERRLKMSGPAAMSTQGDLCVYVFV